MKDLALKKANNLIELLNIEVNSQRYSCRLRGIVTKKILDLLRNRFKPNITKKIVSSRIRWPSWKGKLKSNSTPIRMKKVNLGLD